MPRGTTPLPLHSGQAMPICAAMALRMKALLLGSLLSSSASSFSTLKATTAVLGGLRGMGKGSLGKDLVTYSSVEGRARFRKRRRRMAAEPASRGAFFPDKHRF